MWFLKFTGLSKLWGYVIATGIVILGILGAYLKIDRSGQKKGRAKENTERNKESRNVKKRMDDVKPATSSDTDDKLRKGEF